jgi:hypothetical protein
MWKTFFSLLQTDFGWREEKKKTAQPNFRRASRSSCTEFLRFWLYLVDRYPASAHAAEKSTARFFIHSRLITAVDPPNLKPNNNMISNVKERGRRAG